MTGNATAGNVSVTGDVSGATLTGTLATAAQPNVTSVGTLSALTVTGNIQTSANLVTDLIVGRTSSVTITASGSNQNVNLTYPDDFTALFVLGYFIYQQGINLCFQNIIFDFFRDKI